MLIQSHFCVLCGQKHKEKTLCPACQLLLPHAINFCHHCGLPLITKGTCGECFKSPPLYQRLIPAFWYEEPIQTLIHDFKFNQKLFLTPILGKFMLEKIKKHYQTSDFPECLIPVPIHTKRLKERGYHQTHELAKIFSTFLSIPITLKACKKIRHTPPQSELPFQSRQKNVQDAFNAHKISYQHIALIEDVVTTGETLRSLCKALKKENPELSIDIWCLARTRPVK